LAASIPRDSLPRAGSFALWRPRRTAPDEQGHDQAGDQGAKHARFHGSLSMACTDFKASGFRRLAVRRLVLRLNCQDPGAAIDCACEMTSAQQQATLAGSNCQIAFDNLTRQLYATDASIYQIEPMAVAFPRGARQAGALMQAALQAGVPVIPAARERAWSAGRSGRGSWSIFPAIIARSRISIPNVAPFASAPAWCSIN